MLRVPASQLLGSSAPQPLPLGGVAGARPSAVRVQASASRKRRAAKRNGDHARTDGVRTTAGKGFGNTHPGSLNSTSASERQKPSAPRFARDEQGNAASLAQHIGKAGQELQQQKQQEQQEGRSKDDQSYLDQHDASAENIEHQLQQIEATMQQTEQQAKQALEEAARPPSVADVPKPKRPTRDDVKAAQPDYVVFSKGLGFSKSSGDTSSPIDSTEELHKLNSPTYASQEDARRVQMSDPEHPPSNSSAAQRRGSKDEAHEKLVHAEQVPQPRMGPAGAGIGAVELHGKQQVFTGPQGSNTQDSDGGLSAQQRTETSKDGTAAMGTQPAPPAGGLQGEELQGKGDEQRYAALEREAGETAAPSGDKSRSEQREHASAHDVAVGAVDKVEAAVKSAAGATKHGVEVVAHEAGDAAVAGLNKLGEVGGRVAEKVQPVLADAKAAVTGDARQQQGQDRGADRSSSSDRSSGSRSGEGSHHLLNISSVIDRTAQAADRLAARASGSRSGNAEQAPKADGPVWVGEPNYDGSASSAGSQGGAAKADGAAGDAGSAGNLDQQLQEAESARGKVTESIRSAKERLSQLRSQGAQSAGTGSAMPPAGAALAGGPVGGSTGTNANVDGEIQKLEADLDEALTVLDQLDDAVERVKSKQADGGKSGSSSGLGSSSAFSAGGSGKAASSREAEMARLGGGAGGGGSNGGSGGGGSGGRGGSGGSGRGGEGAGAGGEGGRLPEWVVPAFGVALAFAAYKATIGKKKEPEPEEQIEQGVAAAKAKAKQQAKLQAEKAKAAAEKAKQAGASALETAKSKAHDAKGRALNAKDDVKSKALSATEDIRHKALSTKEKAAEKAGQLKEKASEAASGAIDTIKREGGRKDTWLAALGVVVGLGLIFGSGGGKGGDGNGFDERGYAKENEAWRGKAKKGQQVGDNVSGDIGGVSTVAPLDSTYVDYADSYKRGLAAGDAAVAPGPVDDA